MDLNFLSWNVNGLNSPQKRKKVFYWVNRQKCDVTCLQKIHIKELNKRFLMNNKLGKEFYSLSKVKKRSVVIYVKEHLKPRLVFQNEDGRMIAVEISDQDKKILIIGLYAPNGAKEKFFGMLKEKLDAETYNQILVMGDFNGVIDPDLDKSSKKRVGVY